MCPEGGYPNRCTSGWEKVPHKGVDAIGKNSQGISCSRLVSKQKELEQGVTMESQPKSEDEGRVRAPPSAHDTSAAKLGNKDIGRYAFDSKQLIKTMRARVCPRNLEDSSLALSQ